MEYSDVYDDLFESSGMEQSKKGTVVGRFISFCVKFTNRKGP